MIKNRPGVGSTVLLILFAGGVTACSSGGAEGPAAGSSDQPMAQSQVKGGGDETGPYDLVPNWPQDPCGPGYQVGSTGGILAESPDRVFILQRGWSPRADEPVRSGASYLDRR